MPLFPGTINPIVPLIEQRHCYCSLNSRDIIMRLPYIQGCHVANIPDIRGTVSAYPHIQASFFDFLCLWGCHCMCVAYKTKKWILLIPSTCISFLRVHQKSGTSFRWNYYCKYTTLHIDIWICLIVCLFVKVFIAVAIRSEALVD